MPPLAARLLLFSALLLGLPLLGAWVNGQPLAPYLDFPFDPQRVEPAPFSAAVLLIIALPGAAMIGWFALGWWRSPTDDGKPATPTRRFPWWGWTGLALTTVTWLLAWNRFEWFESLQRHTFTPLWIGYILVINALAWRRTGQSLLTHHPRYLLRLFPLSAVFWWYFEFLNGFVHNWYYSGTDVFSDTGRTLHASLAFATVLPAVMSTTHWLRSLIGVRPWPLPAIQVNELHMLARATLWGSALVLLGVAGHPDILFPFIWIAPGALLLALQVLQGERTLLAPLAAGDWRPIYLPALAALICGLFWEMWNHYSLAKWHYTIPYVQVAQLFEMPLPGYIGYLPFGLTCAVVAAQVDTEHAMS
jgi:hypothetical protein